MRVAKALEQLLAIALQCAPVAAVHAPRELLDISAFGEGWAVFLCRFIPILRTFINPVVGILGMSARKFAFWNILGGIIWTESIILAGRVVGEKLHIDRYVLPVVGFVVVVSILSILFEVRRNRKRQAATGGQ